MAKEAKGKKFGRNMIWCGMYRQSRRQEINKAIKLARHIVRQKGACHKAREAFDATMSGVAVVTLLNDTKNAMAKLVARRRWNTGG